MKNVMRKPNLLAGLVTVTLLSTLGAVNVAQANVVDEAASACVESARLITEDDDLDAAIEEATWCLTSLKQLKEEITLSLLPDELDGFEGGDIENQNVLGMVTVSRVYTRDGESLTVSMLTGGAGALGGLGQLAQLSQMFGAETSGSSKKLRIQRRTVLASDEGGTGSLSVELKNGGTLQVESQDLDSDELVEFMREFPIAEIDDATAQ